MKVVADITKLLEESVILLLTTKTETHKNGVIIDTLCLGHKLIFPQEPERNIINNNIDIINI